MGISFVCCECEWYYQPGLTGDSDERMCYKCLNKDEDTEEEHEQL